MFVSDRISGEGALDCRKVRDGFESYRLLGFVKKPVFIIAPGDWISPSIFKRIPGVTGNVHLLVDQCTGGFPLHYRCHLKVGGSQRDTEDAPAFRR